MSKSKEATRFRRDLQEKHEKRYKYFSHKKRRLEHKKETVEEFLARGGKIKKPCGY